MAIRIRPQREEPAKPPDHAVNDPVAQATDWKPVRPGGASFKTYHLVQDSPQCISFRATRSAQFFYGLFMLVGFGIACWVAYDLWDPSPDPIEWGLLFPLFLSCVFGGVGAVMLVVGTHPILFDKTSGWFWKGRRKPTEVFDANELKQAARLTEIHALQVIRFFSRSGRGPGFQSYELNLVLKDGRRIEIVNHAKWESLETEVRQLSQFLGCPVWQAF